MRPTLSNVSPIERIGLRLRRTLQASESDAFRGRVGAAPFGKRPVVGARSHELSHQAVVPLVTPGLVIDPVLLVVLFGPLLLDGPWFRPRRRIFQRGDELDRVRAGTGPPLNQMEVLPSALVAVLGGKVRDVDHQRVPLPPAARIALPLRMFEGRCGAAVTGMMRPNPCPWCAS